MTFKESLHQKRVTVIGAARSGIAVANAVMRLGGRAKISEYKPLESIEKELQLLNQRSFVQIEAGGHTKEFILDSDLIVLSPGVRQDIAPVLWARAAAIEVIGEIEFAYRLCPCPIVAVTGSNGKTTTVTLIHDILTKAGKKSVLCGNIGSPFSKHVLELTVEHIVVLEISSFQLESTQEFRPTVAVFLNFSQNHLDRHKDLTEYYEAKCRIFKNQRREDFAIINTQQESLRQLAKTLTAKVIFYNGTDAPKDIEHPNYLAALAATGSVGVDASIAREVFASFKGVEHRQEFVRSINGVDYINDSKSTTPEAGQWALTHMKKPLVMICGGSDKHLDFSPLKDLVSRKVKHLITIGQTKDILKETFTGVTDVRTAQSLKEAVEMARASAQSGDCVILSPMCASFDMFNDYEHRGRCFKEIVKGI